LLGSGATYTSVDCQTSTLSHYYNIDNAVQGGTQTPFVTSGFGTAPAVVGGSSGAFQVTIGTGGTANVGLLNFLTAAPHAYACDATDTTNYASFVEVAVPLSTQYTYLYNLSRTTGAAIAWTAGDVIVVKCNAY
jgi:hypothetical protein